MVRNEFGDERKLKWIICKRQNLQKVFITLLWILQAFDWTKTGH